MLSFSLRMYRNTALLFAVCGMLISSSLYAQTGSWTPLTHLAPHYNSGVMLVLTDGTVIAKTSSGGSDGYGNTWDKLTPVNGSYINGTWTTIAAMARTRLYFSTQVLPDGRVYVCGGEYGPGGSYGEVYNPITNTWTATPGPFPQVVSDANSEILPSGKVLQASVDEAGSNLNYLWNPTTNTYTAAPNCLRIDNEAVWVKLPDSSILFLDNYGMTSERYIPQTNTWINDATAPENLYDPYGSEAGAGFLLPDGRVFFIGSLPTTLYYTPSGNTSPGTWAAGPAIPGSYGAADAASAMMVNGKILLTVSPTPTDADHFPSPTKYYEFDYVTNTFTQVGAPGGGTTTANSCFISNMVDLPDGTVLFANQGDDQYYEYVPGSAPLAAGKPTINAVNRVNCDTFQVTGTLFNGITEGAAYGDDWQMSTNYPIVRLTSGANTYYATVYNWNRIGAVMTGSLPDTAIFKLPAGLAAGTYSVTVVANGNPSAPFTINTALTISPLPATVCAGATTTLTDIATIGSWSTANTAIATIGSASGILTGVTNGATTVSYSIGGCYATASVTVNAGPLPITGTQVVCAGSTTTLSDATTTGTWSSSNANAAVGTSGVVTGVTAGTSIITYTRSNSCYDTAIVTVNALPSATITASGATTFCTGSSVTLNATTGTGYTYQWQIGGVNISGATTAAYIANTTGNYSVIVTTSNGCSATSAATSVTATSGPGATITPAGPTTFCPGGSVVLNANTGAGITYQWQVDGANIPGATLSSYTASAGGSYVVIVSQGVCVATSAATVVTITTSATIAAISGASSVCTGQEATLTDAITGGTWTSSNTAIATAGSSTGIISGVAAGTATITYTIVSSCGTIDTTTVITVNASPAVADIAGTPTVCMGTTTSLGDATASGAWSSSNTSVATISSTGVLTGVTTGTSQVSYSVTNTAGCVTSAVTTVTVYAPFTASITPAGPTTFCTGGYVILNATSGTGYTYQWQMDGANIPGATLSDYTAAAGGNYTAVVTNPGGCAAVTTGVAVTVNSGTIVTPSVSITASLGTAICLSSPPSTFTATAVNGGSAPAYQWFVNGIAVGTGTTYTYSPAGGDIVKCVLTSNATCAFPITATSSVVMTITPPETPAVSITSIHGDTTCAGDTVQYAAVPVFGGTAPTYLWTENGTNVATGPYYLYPPHDGDTLVVTMTSNFPCLVTPVAVSNMFIIHALAPTTNTLSVTVAESSIMTGSVDTFTAIASGAGSSPSFQWMLNGLPIPGATLFRYVTDSLKSGQVISCRETSNFMCAEPPTVLSGGITVSVTPTGVQQVGYNTGNFTLVPNPNSGVFTVNGTLRSPSDNKVSIIVTNVLGQTVYKKTAVVANGNLNEQVTLSNTIAAGTYQVSVTSGQQHAVFHVVVEK